MLLSFDFSNVALYDMREVIVMDSKCLEILGRTISERTSEEIERILSYIQHPVIFKPLQNQNPYGFGRSDYLSEPDWIVYSITDIPQPAFEANLLHELYHLCQVKEGFPLTSTKVLFNNKEEQTLINRVGGAVASTILDLDVCDRIGKFGLTSDYFFNIRYRQALAYHVPERIDSRSVFVFTAVRLAGIILQNNRWQSNEVIQHLQSENIRLVRKGKGLASTIKRIGHDSPEKCFRCLIASYDYLDIWNWQEINFQGFFIQSSEQAKTFLSHFRQDI